MTKEASEWSDRGAAAGHRAEELRTLRDRLFAGEDLDEEDLALARERADEAAARADRAHHRAADAHAHAAAAHRAAAAAADRAGHPEVAERHRRAADADDVDGAAELAHVAEAVPDDTAPTDP